MEILKYCPICKRKVYFQWRIEREDVEINNKDFFLECVSCGFFASEVELDNFEQKLCSESLKTAERGIV